MDLLLLVIVFKNFEIWFAFFCNLKIKFCDTMKTIFYLNFGDKKKKKKKKVNKGSIGDS